MVHYQLAVWASRVAETTNIITQTLRKATSKGMFGRYHIDPNAIKATPCEYTFLPVQHVVVLQVWREQLLRNVLD